MSCLKCNQHIPSYFDFNNEMKQKTMKILWVMKMIFFKIICLSAEITHFFNGHNIKVRKQYSIVVIGRLLKR